MGSSAYILSHPAPKQKSFKAIFLAGIIASIAGFVTFQKLLEAPEYARQMLQNSGMHISSTPKKDMHNYHVSDHEKLYSITDIVDPIVTLSEKTADVARIIFPRSNPLERRTGKISFENTIQSGYTLAGTLLASGVPAQQTTNVIDALSPHVDMTQLQAGTVIKLDFSRQKQQKGNRFFSEYGYNLKKLVVKISPGRDVVVIHKGNNQYQAREILQAVTAYQQVSRVKITHSLYQDAIAAGLPTRLMHEFIRIFSYDTDFQRELRRGDYFELGYESYKNKDGKYVGHGKLMYAMLSINGQEKYRYRLPDQKEWVDEHGKSNKKFLMRTPIDGARLSSGFGMRRHPVLGYNRMHKGIDFAAPTGTPIFAAGDGVVQSIGYRNGYGNMVKLKHGRRYGTGYAHMSRFSPNIKVGSRVKQGQIIGYVGSTGMSTGPHLHYEVYKDGKPINPLSKNIPVDTPPTTQERVNFKKHVALINKLKQGHVNVEVVNDQNQLKTILNK